MTKHKSFNWLFTLMLQIFPLFIFSVSAQSKATEETLTTQFFNSFKTDPVKAYHDVFSDNPYISKSDLEGAESKFKDYLADLGSYYGYEAISIKKAGESSVLKSFLVKFDRQPVRLTFILYKPKDKWKIQSVTYDSEINEELRNAAKLDH